MKRRVGRILVALSLAVSLLSLIAWPLSYFCTVRFTHIGSASTHHCWMAAGQIMWMHQFGSGMPQFLEDNGIKTGKWYVESSRYRARHYDSVDRWNSFRENLRFQNRSYSATAKRGGLMAQRVVGIPFWPIAWLFAMPPAIAYQRRRVRQKRIRDGLCLRCGYDLRASGPRCPECGFAREPDAKTLVTPMTNC